GRGEPVAAPGLAALVRVGMEQELVRAEDAGGLGARERLGLRAPGRAEAVVVEEEERHDDELLVARVPDRERILRGDDAVAPARLDEVAVARLAAELHLVLRKRPEVVVSGHPDDLREPRRERREGRLDLTGAVGDVAADEQP